MLSDEDRDRIGALFRAYSEQLFRYAMRQPRVQQAAADDLVQDAFKRAALSWYVVPQNEDPEGDEFLPLGQRSDEEVLAFLLRVVAGKNKDLMRRSTVAARNLGTLAHDALQSQSDPADRVAGDDHVTRALMSLPPQQRRVAWLRWRRDMSTREIAFAMSISESSVRTHLQFAAAKLEKALDLKQVDEADSTEGGDQR